MGSNRTDWKKQTEVQGQEMGNRTTGGGEKGEEQEDKKKCTREGNIKKGVSEQCWQLKRISRPEASNVRPVGQI